jgi:tetratricopeptide (TPR) repeat protein
MALVARWYAANTRYDRRDVETAHREIDALAAELETKPGYHALAAGVQWELALCRYAEGDLTGALAALDVAAERYRQAGERSNLAAIENLRAAALDVLGRPDEAWSARLACLAEESRQRSNDRLARDLSTASAALVRAGRGDAALSFLRIEESVERSLGSNGLLVHALAREAELDANLGDDDAAAAAAAEAHEVAARLADATLRIRELAVADLAEGAAVLRRDPFRARELLTRAIGPLTSASLLDLAEALLLRAGAAALLGDAPGQARDLDTGIEALARYRVALGGREPPGVYDTGTRLFAQAVRLHVASGDVARAFDCVERSRGAHPAGLAALRQLLTGSGTAVLESFVAPPDVFTFTITEHGEAVTSRPLPQDGEAGLYETLIRPSEPLLTSVRHLVIVPDPSLADVRYAALADGGGPPLVTRMAVALAPSAAALVREPPRAPGSVVAMALPTIAVALPECAAELADVARLYRRAVTIPQATFAALRGAEADVIHIAGHTTQGAGTEGAVMTFAGGERVPWSRVASIRFVHSPIVTLAACETLRNDGRPDARTLSLGAGFLAAGARDVIGTLVPIADRDAHEMFCRIHRRLAAGMAPDEAVREAQLEDLARGGSAWRAIAVLTDRISI